MCGIFVLFTVTVSYFICSCPPVAPGCTFALWVQRCLFVFQVVDSNGEFFLKSSELFESPVYLEEVADVLCILQAGIRLFSTCFVRTRTYSEVLHHSSSRLLLKPNHRWCQLTVTALTEGVTWVFSYLFSLCQSCPPCYPSWMLRRLFFTSVTGTGFCVCWLLMCLTASMKVRFPFQLIRRLWNYQSHLFKLKCCC